MANMRQNHYKHTRTQRRSDDWVWFRHSIHITNTHTHTHTENIPLHAADEYEIIWKTITENHVHSASGIITIWREFILPTLRPCASYSFVWPVHAHNPFGISKNDRPHSHTLRTHTRKKEEKIILETHLYANIRHN